MRKLIAVLVLSITSSSICFAADTDVAALRKKEKTAFRKMMDTYLDIVHSEERPKPAEFKKLYAKMVADWQKMAKTNYVAAVELADQQKRFHYKTKEGVIKASDLYKAAKRLAKTAEERENMLWKQRECALLLIAHLASSMETK